MPIPQLLLTTTIPGFSRHMLPEKVSCDISEHGILSSEQISIRAAGKDAIACTLVTKLDEVFFAAFPKIKMVANIAVGYDNIDIAAATKYGVIVTNTPGVLDAATADLAFALLLSIARRIPEAENYLRGGHWKYFAMDLLIGTGVFGKTLGIIGFGRIGQAVAMRAKGFSMRVLYHQRRRAPLSLEQETNASYADLTDLLSQSDFVSLHCPLTEDTKHLINAEKLQRMKRSAFLINTARGAVVDEEALITALQEKVIAGAALDVFEHEPTVPQGLLRLPNAVLVPHIGSATTETRNAMGALALNSVGLAFSGQRPHNLVNAEVWPHFLSKIRAEGLVTE